MSIVTHKSSKAAKSPGRKSKRQRGENSSREHIASKGNPGKIKLIDSDEDDLDPV